MKTKSIIICKIHGEFKQTPDSHLKGRGCFECSGRKKHSTKEIIKKFKNIHNDKYDYTKVIYKNYDSKVKIICKKHGEFKQAPKHHINGSGCPGCRQSLGENKIETILKNKQVEFDRQKRFDECKYKYTLPFDFYLKKTNTCIEYDGEQHFKSIKRFGGNKGLKIRKKRDRIKNKFCKKNNIELLRIRFDENLEKKLLNFLKKKIISNERIFICSI